MSGTCRMHVSDKKCTDRFDKVRRYGLPWELEKVTGWNDDIKANVKGREVEKTVACDSLH